MEAVGRGDRVQFICDWEDSAAAGIACSGSWIAQCIWWETPVLWVVLVPSAFIAPQIGDCFYSRLLQTDIIQPVLKHSQLAQAHISTCCCIMQCTLRIFYKICYMNFKSYHYRFKPIRVQQNWLPSAHSWKQLNGLVFWFRGTFICGSLVRRKNHQSHRQWNGLEWKGLEWIGQTSWTHSVERPFTCLDRFLAMGQSLRRYWEITK